jgi:hypothetical protein
MMHPKKTGMSKKPNVIELRDKVSAEIWQVLFWAHHLTYLLNEGYDMAHEEVQKAIAAVWDADNTLYGNKPGKIARQALNKED